MRTLTILILFFFSLSVSNAQVKSYFGGTLNVYASSGTSPEYTIQGFFNDTSGEYPLDSVAVGDIIYVSEGSTCVRLRVDTINSSAGGILNADVYDVDTILLSPPSGIGALMRETGNIALPRYIPGLSETLLSCIRTHMTGKVDEGIGSIDSLRALGDKAAPILIQAFDRVTLLDNCATSATVTIGFSIMDNEPINAGSITLAINASPATITYDVYNADSTSYYFEEAAPRTAGIYSVEVSYVDPDGNPVSDLTTFAVVAGRPDTVTVWLDSITTVTRVCGVEISRDTIATGGGSGTVTSVGLTLPSQFAVTGSPVTTSGTLAGAWNTQANNTVLAGPATGGPLAPTFRVPTATDIAAWGGASGTGTTNRTALWTAATTLGDSYLLQSASALTLDANKMFVNVGGTTASRPAATAGGHWFNTSGLRPQWSDGVSWYEYSPWTRSGNNIYFNTASAGVSIGTTAKEGVLNVAGNVGTNAGMSNVAFFENFNAITSGSNNVGLGYRNFYLGTTLDECVGSGYFNFYSINSARGNIGQGASNFYLAASGDNNVGQGRENFSLGTGTFSTNVGQGYRNFYNHTGGSGNIGQGGQNFQALTTGNYNIGKGAQNFLGLTSGEYNTGLGFRNFQLATSGNYNFATGQNNCRFVTSATATFAGGYLTGPYLSGDNTANYSFFWGYEAMNNATQADNAIAIGYQAGKSNIYLEPILLGKNVTAAVDYHAVIGGTSYTRLTSGLYSWNVNQSLTGKGDYRMKYNSSSGEMEVAPSALSTRGRLTETTTNALTPISTGFIRVAGLSSADLSNFTATDSTLTYTGTESVLMEIRYSGAISMAASGGGTYLARFKVYVNSTAYDESQSEVQVVPAAADTWRQSISGSTWVTLATNDVVSLKFDGTTSGYTLSLEKLNLNVNAL